MNCVVISDTHSRERKIEWFKKEENLKKVDCVIHAGDFSHNQKTHDDFLFWFGNLDIEHKILVAGNHDEVTDKIGYEEMRASCSHLGITYLEDSGVEIEEIRFWGSPMSSEYGDWAFMKNDWDLYTQHWELIPDDTNILITHGPGYGIGDYVFQDGIHDNNVGSKSLNLRIGKLKELKFHFFDHIHDDGGIHQQDTYTAYNASIMNFWFKPEGLPSIFQLNK